jgi:hypothetical protein
MTAPLIDVQASVGRAKGRRHLDPSRNSERLAWL